MSHEVIILGKGRLAFRNGRWYHQMKKKSEREVFRSEALVLLMQHNKKDAISREAWLDVIMPNKELEKIDSPRLE